MERTVDSVRATDRIGQRLGHYRLIRLLGHGRFSEAYLGEHVYLENRNVVKVLHTRLTDDVLGSFLDEICILTQLVHPHIVRVLSCGMDGHFPFLVMDYIPYGTLRQRYPKGVPQPLAGILPHIKQIADALQYAHNKGSIHANIRPENMLLGWNNDVLLSDFAIEAVARSRRYWGLEEVTGIETYLAPEQIEGKLCPASDQYALACVIYEWLSGRPPFRGSSIEVRSQHLYSSPPPLRQVVPAISPDVEEVLLTALAKDPKRRFARIAAFVNALEQAHKTIVLQPSTRASYPVVPAAPVPWPVSSLPVPAESVLPPATPNTAAQSRANGSKRLLSRRGFLAGLAGVVAVSAGAGLWLTLSQRSPTSTRAFNATPAASPTSLPVGTTVFTYRGHPARVSALAWSPNGKHIASASDDMVVQICDGSTGATTLTYRGHSAEVYAVAWSPDGKYIASAGADHMVHVWNAVTGKRIFIYRGHSDAVNALTWSPDSRHIASASDDHTVHVLDAATGRHALIYAGHSAGVLSVAWSLDGNRLASGSWDNTVQIWSAATGDTVITYHGHSAEVYAVAWSPAGNHLASASGDTVVQVCDAATGATTLTHRGHSDVVLAVAWSPGGEYIASAGYDDAVQVWSAATGKHIFSYSGHSNWVDSVAWSPDGKRIASAGYDDTLQVWQAV